MQERSPISAKVTVVEHTADWSLKVRGSDWPTLLRHAAEGVSSLMVEDLSSLATDSCREIDLEAFDAETLLVDWLSELVFLAEMEMLVFSDYEIHQADETSLRATIRGSVVATLEKHVKAVTYHDLQIKQTNGEWYVTVVFDV